MSEQSLETQNPHDLNIIHHKKIVKVTTNLAQFAFIFPLYPAALQYFKEPLQLRTLSKQEAEVVAPFALVTSDGVVAGAPVVVGEGLFVSDSTKLIKLKQSRKIKKLKQAFYYTFKYWLILQNLNVNIKT
jgi:hypothetical protein